MTTDSTDASHYKLLGFKHGRSHATLMITSTGRVFDIKLDKLLKSEIIDQLSRDEAKHIFRRHYANDPIPTHYEMDDRHDTSWMIYTALNLALLTLFIFTGLAATKLVHIDALDLTVTPGLFLYPLTFLIVDILNEAYGLKLARRAILFAFAGNALIVILLGVTTLLPGLPHWSLDEPYTKVITHLSSVLVASSVSFLCSEYVNSYLLCKIKKLTQSKLLFLRVFFSTLFAVIIDSILFCLIAFHGKLDNTDILSMIYVQIAIKILLAFINIFPAYGARALFRRYVPINQLR